MQHTFKMSNVLKYDVSHYVVTCDQSVVSAKLFKKIMRFLCVWSTSQVHIIGGLIRLGAQLVIPNLFNVMRCLLNVDTNK